MMSIIQEYSNHLEEIFENSFDYIYLHDKKGNILDVNNVVVQNLGYSKNEILNMKVTDFLLEEVPSIISDEIKKAMETGVSNKPRTYKVRKKDSTFIYVEVSAIPLKKNGEFYAILGIGHEVTVYKRIEQKFREFEKKFRKIFETIPDLFFLVSSDTTILDYKGNVEDFFVPPKKLINRKISEIVPEDIATLSSNSIKKTIESQEPQIVEYELLIKGINRIFEARHLYFSQDRVLVFIREITERKRSEQKLKESEEKFRNLNYKLEEIVNERTNELKQSEEKYRELFNGMSNGVAVYETLDEGNTFIFKDMNPSGEKISGVKRNDVIGNDVLDQFPKVKTTGLLDTFKTVYKSNTPIRHPIAFYGDETISLWAENYVYKLPTGEIVAVYDDLTALKITEQKLKKLNEELEQKVDERTKELKESEEKFRIITEQSFIGVVMEQDFDIKYVNQQFSTIIGYSTEELLNWKLTDFYDIFHPDDLDKFKEIVDKKTKDIIQDITTFQLRLFKKTGEIIWLELSSKAIIYQDKPANLAFIMDITEKKEADQKIKESEEKFRNITEQSFMGIIIIQAGELKYINKAMANITGYPVEEMLNWSEKDMLKLIYPEDLEIVLNRLQSNIEGKMGPFSSNSIRMINRNGEVRWLEDYTTRILYEGKLANLISMVDITDKKEAEQLIIEENKRLIELYELRKDLITRVSHELKTPMTSIYGANQILIKLYMEEIGEEAQKYIEIGHRGSLRLKQLIDNLLDVSRLDSKKFELRLQKENLVELIVDCVKDMNYLAFNRQLKMKLELPNEVYMDIDRLRFRQVLTNIISNAIKNTPKEGEIFINLVDYQDYIDIQVKDTGVGITEKEKEKLFEKFGKIERYGMDLGVDIEGSGLGLYISKEIVELHGGQIFVESEGRNKGSTFTIRLYKT